MTYQTNFTGSDFAAYYQIRAKILGAGLEKTRILLAAIGSVEIVMAIITLVALHITGLAGMLFAIGVLFFCGGVYYYPVLGKRSAKAIPADMRDLTYTFDEEGLTQAQSRGSAKVEYDRIFACAESKTVFAFFYDETHGFFLPKRSVEDVDALRDFLEEKLGFPLQQYTF